MSCGPERLRLDGGVTFASLAREYSHTWVQGFSGRRASVGAVANRVFRLATDRRELARPKPNALTVIYITLDTILYTYTSINYVQLVTFPSLVTRPPLATTARFQQGRLRQQHFYYLRVRQIVRW